MKKKWAQKVCLIFTLVLGVFILQGCGGDGGGGHWNGAVNADDNGTVNAGDNGAVVVTPDGIAPTVTNETPLDGAIVASTITSISAEFDEAMDPATLTTTSFTLECNGTPVTGGGAVTYQSTGFKATLPLPTATELPVPAACIATITTAATDLSGTALANDYVWNFTTEVDVIRPQVTLTVPATTNPGPTATVTNTPIRATFDEDMNPASITVDTFIVTDDSLIPVLVDGDVTYVTGTKTATFFPLNLLTEGVTYTATIKGIGVNVATDVAGNELAGDSATSNVANDYVWTFTAAGPPPVDAGFGLLTFGIASAGGITNTGATKINGNVVLDPTANCNAVPILELDGPGFGVCGGNLANIPTVNSGDKVITPIYPDTTTAHAVMTELNVEWNLISPASLPGATVLGCGTIGDTGDAGALIGCSGNATLPPGTYISSAGTTIGVSGVLTLDGQGDANAEWFFQAPTALTVANNSQILLTNGAKASNVWWYVGSSATINADSEFQGNILASASISMLSGATSCGRLLAGAEGAGAFTFLGNTVSVPGHSSAPAGCE